MWYWHAGMGWWMVFGAIWTIIFWVAVIALVVWVVRALMRRPYGGPPAGPYPPAHGSSIDIAKERYAKGEITKEQFEQIKRDLSGP